VDFEAGIMWRERTSTLERATGRIVPWVFHRNGKPIRDYYDPMRNVLDAAGLAHLIPYDAKRTAARRFYRGGMSEAMAMRVMGLKTPEMFRRYNITTEEDARAALAGVYQAEAERARERTEVGR
jgi:hypothetical protein